MIIGVTLTAVDRVKLYADNAAAMLSSAFAVIDRGDILGARTPGGERRIVRVRLPAAAVTAALQAVTPTGRVVWEDPYGTAAVSAPPEFAVLRMPVMSRPAGAVRAVARAGVRVTGIAGAAELAEAERVMVDGFPHAHLQPWAPERLLPTRVLQLPGWAVWLAYRGDAPAGACYTFDDGAAVGIYSMATLAAHRGVGVGKALLASVLHARPDRAATLVATAAGAGLYAALGFTAVGVAAWYIHAGAVAVTNAPGRPGRAAGSAAAGCVP